MFSVPGMAAVACSVAVGPDMVLLVEGSLRAGGEMESACCSRLDVVALITYRRRRAERRGRATSEWEEEKRGRTSFDATVSEGRNWLVKEAARLGSSWICFVG